MSFVASMSTTATERSSPMLPLYSPAPRFGSMDAACMTSVLSYSSDNVVLMVSVTSRALRSSVAECCHHGGRVILPVDGVSCGLWKYVSLSKLAKRVKLVSRVCMHAPHEIETLSSGRSRARRAARVCAGIQQTQVWRHALVPSGIPVQVTELNSVGGCQRPRMACGSREGGWEVT